MDKLDIIEIKTERLLLREPSDGDAGALEALMTAKISQWMARWKYPASRIDILSRVSEAKTSISNRTGVSSVIEKEGIVLGWIEIKLTKAERRTGSLSFWVGEAHNGLGYAKEAASHLIPFAALFLSLDVVEAGAQCGNASSLAVMKKLGMRHVGDRMVFAESRKRNELCSFFELEINKLS